ncbi:hypothetical protein NLI96_g9165 [Meripilus lineatus]|uniref:DUF1793-domain-containing protein n=1 Tax=Meripilus lineatus TaxID=2056292 RepID=A0AAD5UY87_9APHY|nr:hypothetical protein NLI96_g9165 [Physisporinus lineatus]
MDLTVTFLSPIEPTDPVKQSLPFVYLSFEASATDGQSHDVQIYSDVGADWIAPSPFACVYSWRDIGTNAYWESHDSLGLPMDESSGQATDVSLLYAMQNVQGLVTRFDSERACHAFFSQSGVSGLSIPQNETMAGHVNVFSSAFDLGTIPATQSPVVWALGLVRNPNGSYSLGSGQSQIRYPYFASESNNMDIIINNVLADFSNALSRAIELDKKLLTDASAISDHYANLVSLSVRQTIGSTELTISKGVDGGWNKTDFKISMKDVGSSRRANPVEVLYAAFPMFLYVTPSYAGRLLAPLLEAQESSLWVQQYSARDIGANYPNTTAVLQAHNQGIEHSGNMLIMTYAHATVSNDQSLITSHYSLLKRWASYLSNTTLTPLNQADASSNSQARSNSTNLAIKGIIGIQAMAEISRILGKQEDVESFSNISSAFAKTWTSLALSSNPGTQHILAGYGNSDSSWSLAYNLLANKLLPTSIIDPNVYQLQTSYYKTLLSDPEVRNTLIDKVWQQAVTSSQFPSTYDAGTGSASGTSSPALGGAFSILALSLFNHISTPSSSSGGQSTSPTKKTNIVGPVVGGVLGGLALVVISLFGLWSWRRKTRNAVNLNTELERRVNPFQMDTPNSGSGDLEAKEMNQRNGAWEVVPFFEGIRPRSGEEDEVMVPRGSIEPSQTGLLVSPQTPSQPQAHNGTGRGVIPSAKAREAGFVLANPQSNTSSSHHSGGQSQSHIVVVPQPVGSADTSSASGSTPSPLPPISPSADSGLGHGSGSGSRSRSQSQPRPSGDSPDIVQIPRSEMVGLREELQNLRQAMQQMQHVGSGSGGGGGRRYRESEAPPGYHSIEEGDRPWD